MTAKPAREIRSELSALGRNKPISPVLTQLIAAVFQVRREHCLAEPRIALEYGCGQLRNLKELRRHFQSVCLVDTPMQLSRTHDFDGKHLTVHEYVKRHYRSDCVTVMTDLEFAVSRMKPDVIFSINVMDVVPPQTRRAMLRNIRQHLAAHGQFASLVPRNDSRTLNLCKHARTYADGHIFPNHGFLTYYRNWPLDQLQQLYQASGLSILRDLSRYRCSCLVCESLSRPRTVTGRRRNPGRHRQSIRRTA
jgi:hypothetical protein